MIVLDPLAREEMTPLTQLPEPSTIMQFFGLGGSEKVADAVQPAPVDIVDAQGSRSVRSPKGIFLVLL